MEASAALSSRGISLVKHQCFSGTRVLQIKLMGTQKPNSSSATTKTVGSKKGTTAIPVGSKNSSSSTGSSVKLLTRVEQLRLLTKAEKAGLLSTAEKAGLSLSTIEQLGLLSKAEELGVLSAATNPDTPSTLLTLSLLLLLLGPAFVFLVPEDATWEVVVQAVVAVVSVVGGSVAFAASNLVGNLQKIK
ncbi:unnamed protein product [Amaranthus hypochondriacus]